MNTFIDQVINELEGIPVEDLRKTCIIFPTRRACLIFRKRFAQSRSVPVWSPGIMAIGDFVSRHSPVPVTDEIPLLLTLYEIYKKHWPIDDFGKFYAWGRMLLNDFDEADKQLQNPVRIFSQISELKKIDATFMPDPESLRWIQEFIGTLDTANLTKIQKRFADTWDHLQQIYTEYHSLLDKKQFCYEGKAYRKITGMLRNGTFTTRYDRFIFAGFYGFSSVEETLIQQLRSTYNVKVLWDADRYYVQNKSHEAGYYFRKSHLYGDFPNFTGDHFSNSVKNIELTGVPLWAGQAKYTGELLARLLSENRLDPDRTAIVLPDENMLFPVLYAIPQGIETINVTMGYPLQQSQYAELIRLLHEVSRRSKKSKNNEWLFHHATVRKLLNHPLFRSRTDPRAAKKDSETGHYLDATRVASIYGLKQAETFFTPIQSPGDLLSYVSAVLKQLSDDFKDKPWHFEDRIIEYIAGELNVLADYTKDHLAEIGTETMWQMIIECISGLKVPFSGEPVKGLQVMGFLETRALDFQTLIILNVNEGVLPASSANKSFIPYALRKAFGLATYEDQDASFAYHFYRLLHKAENIYLLYNSEVGKTNAGEPGRYMLQVKQELKKHMGDRLRITTGFINTPIREHPVLPIVIPKSEAIMEQLNQFRADDNGKAIRYFSSSALSTYIGCGLRFYFRYIAGLKEQQNEEDSIEDHTFGSILHKAVEKLYSQVGSIVDAGVIDTLLPLVNEAVSEAVSEVFNIQESNLEGNDILLAEVIRELVKRLLKTDKTDTPFHILGLEKEIQGIFEHDDLRVGIRGNLDRVDEQNGVVRIIDYKTGKVILKSKEPADVVSDPDNRYLFQLCFYMLLYRMEDATSPVKAGIYMIRNMTKGIKWAGNGEPIPSAYLESYKKELAGRIGEILNPAIDFIQTSELSRCEYCPYRQLCDR